ncbi:MAG: hypothetical protein K6B12_02350 [Clostridiales bacterium]|nr:hypothetical protein [Clostridiales bacterium]
MSNEKKKKKRWSYNRGRDAFVDYVVTNRDYTRENMERQKEMPKEWRKSEIIMVVVIALALVGCLVRYVILK